ncbi:hypothetical protein BABINDRAFT_160263 [Babjeviella inositovora NRRL Y-12698]|uniref:Telomere length regulation protein conserved domain-containing protein n=1 Tax=Babjeviella inositovora NRRL Y-12698 TaxID=984486 RepID=A0A1E3QYC0_9ASCO|nr:uncharacterized protein BABINDRAFT_160263 [Babjeviella inositovora NRRL Y-12698]ODQ82067.1 hypothetical protein BABINDRAFT_160263 [Babjeviella inositovora NRRL Y-12698]
MTNDLSGLIDRLSLKPSLSELEDILRKLVADGFTSQPTSIQLKAAASLISHVLPDLYFSLDGSCKHLISEIFTSIVGIGNLASRIQMLTLGKDPQVAVLLEVLMDVLQVGSVEKLVLQARGNRVELKEIEKMFFKGKLLGILNEASPIAEQTTSHNLATFLDIKQYSRWLSTEILTMSESCPVSSITPFVTSLLSLHATASLEFLGLFCSSNNMPYLLQLYTQLTPIAKRSFISRNLVAYISRIPVSGSDSQVISFAYLLSQFNVRMDMAHLMRANVTLSDDRVIIALGLLLSQDTRVLGDTFEHLLAIWSDASFVKASPLTTQQDYSKLILVFVYYLPQSEIQRFLKSPVFLEGISTRLGSFSNNVKSLGMVLADKMCEKAGESSIFSTTKEQELELFGEIRFIETAAFERQGTVLWESLEVSKPVPTNHQTVIPPQSGSLAAKGSNRLKLERMVIDSDDESSDDDDPTVTAAVKPAKPVYVHDLLSYLTTAKTHPQAYDRVSMALTIAPTLIRQKARFGQEVMQYYEALTKCFVGMSDEYGTDDFEKKKLNGLVAMVVALPTAVPQLLVRLLMAGDYSLQQRLAILSSISLGARELRGYQDGTVTESYVKQLFPTKLLPEQLHKQFVVFNKETDSEDHQSLLFGVDAIANEIQDGLLQAAKQELENHLVPAGKVLRISRNLVRQKEAQKTPPVANNYTKIAGKAFFFPLVAAWNKLGGGINIGHYSPVLSGHYVKTLALLLHAAYPSSPDLADMIGEMLHLITGLRKTMRTEDLPVLEAMLTAVLIVIDCCDGQWLAQTYQAEVTELQSWIEATWEGITEPKVNSMAAGVVIKLNGVMEQYQEALIRGFM